MSVLVGYASKHGGQAHLRREDAAKASAARAMMPEGDFRDWTQIEVWARSIAQELTQLDTGRVQEEP